VHGATGGVGLAAVQIARAHGITVIGTGGSDRGLTTVRENGADHVFNHSAPGYLDDVMRATGGRGVDVILEMAAHVNLDKDFGLIANRGRIVVIGNRGRVEIDARQAMGKDATILGMTLFNISDPDMASINAYMVAGLANGTLKPVVGREFPLADAAKAHDAVMAAGAHGKIVLVP
jgi:NADPH2:quinone reductase